MKGPVGTSQADRIPRLSLQPCGQRRQTEEAAAKCSLSPQEQPRGKIRWVKHRGERVQEPGKIKAYYRPLKPGDGELNNTEEEEASWKTSLESLVNGGPELGMQL